MEPNAARFPFPLPSGIVGEYKAKVKQLQQRAIYMTSSPAKALSLLHLDTQLIKDKSASMSATFVLFLAFAIGIVSGMRSLTAPAVAAWGARRGWLNLAGTRLAFMGSTAAVAIFTALAIAELIADKLPSTPSRTAPVGLIARFFCGALAGACVGVSAGQTPTLGALLGAAGGIAGAFAGYQWRTGLVKALKVPDFVIAVLEDAIAIGAGLLIVSR